VRAFALAMMPGIDLRLIHLVRDGRGVAWSKKKVFKKDEKAGIEKDRSSRPIWRTIITWKLANLQSAWVQRQLDPKKSISVRYEDFIANPRETLARIGALIQCDLVELGEAFAAGTVLPIGHTIAGNRMRMAGSVRLHPDTEWTRKMPAKDQWLFWALAGWLMRQYGYRRPGR